VARGNAARLGLAGRVRFLEGTIPRVDSAGDGEGAGFDLIVANLPYVAEGDWPGLAPEVTEWEPPEALLAGPDGLDAYRELASQLSGRISSRYATSTTTSIEESGRIAPAVACEVGEGQAGDVGAMLRGAGFEEIETRRDLAGIERVVLGRR
jgi:release factor glutamine methyltransferase